jgi:hypothetical protein
LGQAPEACPRAGDSPDLPCAVFSSGIGIAVALWAVAVIVLLSSLAVVWIASPIDLITESSSPGRWRM